MKKTILFILIIFFLTGCTGALKPPIDLIKKPKLARDQAFPREIIDKNLPAGSNLIRPHVSNNLSSVDYLDWDGDGEEEVYAFYSNKSKSKTGFMIIDKRGQRWYLKAKVEELGSDISYAEFIDLNDDGIKELILGVTMSDELFKSLIVYEWKDNQYVQLYKDAYSEIIVEDINRDFKKDIITLKLDRNKIANASLLIYKDNALKLVHQIDMDEFISGYYNVSFGKASSDTYGLFVDKKIGSKSATNIIIYKDDKLELVFNEFNNQELRYRQTIKDVQIASRDIDNDDIIEIGNVILPPLYKNIDENNPPPYLNTWYKWDGFSNLNLVKMNFISESEGYRLDFPKRWADEITKSGIGIIKSRPDVKRKFLNVYYTTKNTSLYKLFTIETMDQKSYQRKVKTLRAQGATYYNLGISKECYYIGYNETNQDVIPKEYLDHYKQLLLTEAEVRKLFQIVD